MSCDDDMSIEKKKRKLFASVPPSFGGSSGNRCSFPSGKRPCSGFSTFVPTDASCCLRLGILSIGMIVWHTGGVGFRGELIEGVFSGFYCVDARSLTRAATAARESLCAATQLYITTPTSDGAESNARMQMPGLQMMGGDDCP
jgi:hypothetical protein